jgi:hypothetical protein
MRAAANHRPSDNGRSKKYEPGAYEYEIGPIESLEFSPTTTIAVTQIF